MESSKLLSDQKDTYSILPQLLAAFTANIGGFGLGAMNGYTSPALPDMIASGDFGRLTDNQQSWIGSIAPLACFISVYPTGYAIQKFGRKPVLIFLCFPFILGWLLIAYASSVKIIYVGRFVTGICSGGFSLTAPVFIGEISQDKIRGALGSTFQLLIVTGILFTYIVGTFVSWRWLAFICAFPPIFCAAILFMFIPESPRHLLHKGKRKQARTALMWFRGTKYFEAVQHEFTLIDQSVKENSENVTHFRDFFQLSVLKPVSIGICLLVFQQFSGIDAITVYTVQIFHASGSNISAHLSTIIFGTVQLIASFAAIFICEKLGRRFLLLGSGTILSLALATLGWFFYLQESKSHLADSISWLPLVSVIIYTAAFDLGIGPLAWQMFPELLPNHVIGISSALATSSLWILSFLITRFFNDVRKALNSSGCFWMFSSVSLFGVFYTYFIVPETKGRSLDEIQQLIRDGRTN